MAKSEQNQNVEKAKKRGHTEIRACGCNHPYQDSLYGKGRRVFNVGKERVSCTVCCAEQPR